MTIFYNVFKLDNPKSNSWWPFPQWVFPGRESWGRTQFCCSHACLDSHCCPSPRNNLPKNILYFYAYLGSHCCLSPRNNLPKNILYFKSCLGFHCCPSPRNNLPKNILYFYACLGTPCYLSPRNNLPKISEKFTFDTMKQSTQEIFYIDSNNLD